MVTRLLVAFVVLYVLWPQWLAVPAKLLALRYRHHLAARAYRLAAALAPPWHASLRAAWLALASNSAFLAGRVDEAVALGLRAIRVAGMNARMVLAVIVPTANALGSRGDARADDLWRSMLELATRAGLDGRAAVARAGLGLQHKRRAQYEEAEVLLRAALDEPEAARTALTALGEMQGARGEHEAALVTWSELATRLPSRPHQAEQTRGLVAFLRARTLLELQRLDEADTSLQEAEAAWGRQARLRSWCAAVRSVLEARRGRAEAARALIEPLLAELPTDTGDRASTTGILASAAWVELALGDFARGRELVRRYFAAGPDDDARPRMHYCDGMCARGAGDRDEAILSFTRAAAYGEVFEYARLARDRLAELRAPAAPST